MVCMRSVGGGVGRCIASRAAQDEAEASIWIAHVKAAIVDAPVVPRLSVVDATRRRSR